MSKWFPQIDDAEGRRAALKMGFFGSLAFGAMIALGMVLLIFTSTTPVMDQGVSDTTAPLIGMLMELAIVLVAAWRFKVGKGLVWGIAILMLFVIECLGKITSGTTNVGWMIFYIGILTALVNGVRGAWASRTGVEESAEAFD